VTTDKHSFFGHEILYFIHMYICTVLIWSSICSKRTNVTCENSIMRVVILNKMYSHLQKLVRIWQNCNLLPFRKKHDRTRQSKTRSCRNDNFETLTPVKYPSESIECEARWDPRAVHCLCREKYLDSLMVYPLFWSLYRLRNENGTSTITPNPPRLKLSRLT
jgi:hypothetical protein